MKSEIEGEAPLSVGIRVYFQERLRQRLYDLVINEFDHYKSTGRTRAQLAARLGKRPEQITRWLTGPGNLTLDTLSDLLLAISGAELAMTLNFPTRQPSQAPRIPEGILDARRSNTSVSTAKTARTSVPSGNAATLATAILTQTQQLFMEPV